MKLFDLAVVTGEYTDRNGQHKKRYQNVGSVMQGQNGGQYVILNRWFNPAGIPNPENRGSVVLSCYEPRQPGQQPRGGGQGYQQPQSGGQGYGQQDNFQQPQGYGQQQPQHPPLDDQIPF